MTWLSLFSVLLGGAIGSALRWALGIALNPLLPALPLGTLTVNLVGGFIIGTTVLGATTIDCRAAVRQSQQRPGAAIFR